MAPRMSKERSQHLAAGEVAQAARFATIHDVAREAGVSIGTVSKALNNTGRLSNATREQVRMVSERLRFRPNNLAQSLHTRRSSTIGLLSNDSYGRFSIPILQGIESTLSPEKLSVLVCNAGDDKQSERQHLDTLMGRRVDGIILTARRIDHRFSLSALGIPIVHVYAQSTDPDAVCLLPDDREGGWLGTRRLTGLGRTRITHITGPAAFEAVRLRAEGYRNALEQAGLVSQVQVLNGPWSEAWGYQGFLAIKQRGPIPDAVFCGSDQIARGVLDAVRECGMSAPEDVAVVGFDNWTIMAEAARPALTTVDPNLRFLGEAAGKLLLHLIAEPGCVKGVQCHPCKLIVRRSCGARPSATSDPVEHYHGARCRASNIIKKESFDVGSR